MPITPTATRQLFEYITDFYKTLNVQELMNIDVNDFSTFNNNLLPSGFQFIGVDPTNDDLIITVDTTNDNIRNIIGTNRLHNSQITQLKHQIINDIMENQNARYDEYLSYIDNTSEGGSRKKYKLHKKTKRYYYKNKSKSTRKRKIKRKYYNK